MAKTFVGPQLRQLRRDRRQTQAELAKALGVSAGYVNLLENNERSLSLRILMAVATIMAWTGGISSPTRPAIYSLSCAA